MGVLSPHMDENRASRQVKRTHVLPNIVSSMPACAKRAAGKGPFDRKGEARRARALSR
ncbi:hypothetical protein HMPREF0762_00315 [Slackia exigua ATCC 700122]|uniref:Uncharacterized protein n=1 Tax=Slackia exigua (strain ATCC 700122 / DSM 15923 / CIP 105133 / JCM 11022 / KCTC 5966 / S-7) TaxID=649764 RepID=D0WET3_SLAES|nr:hypothetical protein HMPREF0762_00315 [Slackia exigua ATCC 700122]